MRAETWQVAFEALRSNKVRTFLTTLGITIGSASLVLVVTVALTGKRYITAQIEGVGTNVVFAEYVRPVGAQSEALADEISPGDMEAVARAVPAVRAVAGTNRATVSVVAGRTERTVALVGITKDFQSIRNLELVRGRMLDEHDMSTRSKVCLVSEELARLVFPYEDPVGKNIRLGELRFDVVGVFGERVSTFGQSEIKAETVLVPFGLMKTYSGRESLDVLYVQAARPEDVSSVTRQVEEILKSRHRPGAVFRVQNLTSLLEAAGNISLALTIILLLVASIALLIGGIGIMNIMLVTVTQRTREIGIRKAIGATRREILWQFLTEAGLISGTGALLGILIAVAISAGVRFIPVFVPPAREWIPPDAEIPISWISVAVAFIVSSMTGILFGLLPANRAAKLQPTESLRYE